MTAAPLIRPAVSDDDAALLALDGRSWSSTSGFPSVQHERRRTFFTDRITPDTHLVAEYGGEVAGYICVQPKTRFPEGAHVYALYGLVVDPRARRLGIASALLDAAERRARDRCARKLSLHVLGTNAAAIRLYQRHGFVFEGRYVDDFLIEGRSVDDVTMGKHLE